ncbi:MAG: hypothetical protein JXR70_03705 [Spirochaetales bacterium]|nr:hypothetical protein [Spirochaetales bacterium]
MDGYYDLIYLFKLNQIHKKGIKMYFNSKSIFGLILIIVFLITITACPHLVKQESEPEADRQPETSEHLRYYGFMQLFQIQLAIDYKISLITIEKNSDTTNYIFKDYTYTFGKNQNALCNGTYSVTEAGENRQYNISLVFTNDDEGLESIRISATGNNIEDAAGASIFINNSMFTNVDYSAYKLGYTKSISAYYLFKSCMDGGEFAYTGIPGVTSSITTDGVKYSFEDYNYKGNQENSEGFVDGIIFYHSDTGFPWAEGSLYLRQDDPDGYFLNLEIHAICDLGPGLPFSEGSFIIDGQHYSVSDGFFNYYLKHLFENFYPPKPNDEIILYALKQIYHLQTAISYNSPNLSIQGGESLLVHAEKYNYTLGNTPEAYMVGFYELTENISNKLYIANITFFNDPMGLNHIYLEGSGDLNSFIATEGRFEVNNYQLEISDYRASLDQYIFLVNGLLFIESCLELAKSGIDGTTYTPTETVTSYSFDNFIYPNNAAIKINGEVLVEKKSNGYDWQGMINITNHEKGYKSIGFNCPSQNDIQPVSGTLIINNFDYPVSDAVFYSKLVKSLLE